MIHSIKMDMHLPGNPEQWLTKWSKDTPAQFTFVLDGADDVLESNDKNTFLTILRATREIRGPKERFASHQEGNSAVQICL